MMYFATGISKEYFEWLYDLIDPNGYSRRPSYTKLLEYLHDTAFIFSIAKDENRAKDGADLRYRFALSRGFHDVPECLDGPCSILEMMVALAIRCETEITDDPDIGDRTGQWFWGMIASLGLSGMYDDRFDVYYVDEVIDRFLDRDYEPDGRGGLFTIRHPRYDMRDVEIWCQLNDYLNSIC